MEASSRFQETSGARGDVRGRRAQDISAAGRATVPKFFSLSLCLRASPSHSPRIEPRSILLGDSALSPGSSLSSRSFYSIVSTSPQSRLLHPLPALSSPAHRPIFVSQTALIFGVTALSAEADLETASSPKSLSPSLFVSVSLYFHLSFFFSFVWYFDARLPAR